MEFLNRIPAGCVRRTRLRKVADIVGYQDSPPLLRVSGDEDRNTQGHRRAALSRALAAADNLRVDLTELRFADPSLMVDLAMVARRLRAAGLGVVLHGAQPHIATLIEMVGLHRMEGIEIVPGPASAERDAAQL